MILSLLGLDLGLLLLDRVDENEADAVDGTELIGHFCFIGHEWANEPEVLPEHLKQDALNIRNTGVRITHNLTRSAGLRLDAPGKTIWNQVKLDEFHFILDKYHGILDVYQPILNRFHHPLDKMHLVSGCNWCDLSNRKRKLSNIT